MLSAKYYACKTRKHTACKTRKHTVHGCCAKTFPGKKSIYPDSFHSCLLCLTLNQQHDCLLCLTLYQQHDCLLCLTQNQQHNCLLCLTLYHQHACLHLLLLNKSLHQISLHCCSKFPLTKVGHVETRG